MSVSIMASAGTDAPPIVGKLKSLFEALPDDELIAKLRGPMRRGPKGHDTEVLWRCFVTYYALGIESVSALLRLLRDNPYIAQACGVTDTLPSQPTLSRFGSRLSRRWNSLAVKGIFRKLTTTLYDTLPGFGETVAIDSTDVKGWSNGGKKGKRTPSAIKRHPRLAGEVSDADAGWVVKTNTEGNRKYVWGFKVHILADAVHELPIAVDVSTGNVHDVKKATPLLAQARYVHSGRFRPRYVVADAGYSSDHLRHIIRRQYFSMPVIDPNSSHKRAVRKTNRTDEWEAAYRTRPSIERLNGRLKAFYKLNDLRVRGLLKVRLHALMANTVLLATAIAFPDSPRRGLQFSHLR